MLREAVVGSRGVSPLTGLGMAAGDVERAVVSVLTVSCPILAPQAVAAVTPEVKNED